MKEFIEQHPLLMAFLISMVVFILNLTRRIKAAESKMPREKKLELNMHRAAMGLRRLERARRILHRFKAVKTVIPTHFMLMPYMIFRLREAIFDTKNAIHHLSAVLRKTASLDCSIDVMQNLDNYISMAKMIRDECRNQVRNRGLHNPTTSPIKREQLLAVMSKCKQDLEKAKTLVYNWDEETKQAELKIAQMVDPLIYRSGGFFRNPFKRENMIEFGQTDSVLLLKKTKRDIIRVVKSIHSLQKAIDVLESIGSVNLYQAIKYVGEALDSIDVSLGDAELPLPDEIAASRSPFDLPEHEKQPGILQRIYTHLAEVEISLISMISTKQKEY